MSDQRITLEYAAVPKPMSRARFALSVGGITCVTIVIAGTAYALVGATAVVTQGRMASPTPIILPAPATAPALPGKPLAPSTQWSPTTQPSTSVE